MLVIVAPVVSLRLRLSHAVGHRLCHSSPDDKRAERDGLGECSRTPVSFLSRPELQAEATRARRIGRQGDNLCSNQKTCTTSSPLIATFVIRVTPFSVTVYTVVSLIGPAAGSTRHGISPALSCSVYV